MTATRALMLDDTVLKKKKINGGLLVTDLFKEQIRLQVTIFLSEHFVSETCSVVTFLCFISYLLEHFQNNLDLSQANQERNKKQLVFVCVCVRPHLRVPL